MANKKINQLVSKNAILSTDIFGIGDATTGQLFKKTIAELQAAIGGAVISVNGLVGTVVLDTDDVQELASPTNKYFTDARARAAISLTVTGNSGASTYSSGTGVLNVPTYTLAGLGGITASFLSGTSGISYNSTTGVISYSGTVYTDSSIRALLSGGTGISYNSSTGAISYSGTVYTDSSVRALISITTTGTSGASTYNNTTGVINVPNYTLAGLGGISLTSLSGGTGITYNNTTGAISYSGTVYTDASIRALFSASGSVSYNNTTGVISLTGGNLTETTSSVLTITGGTGAVIGGGTSIQVKQATTSVSGFLSSTDWTTFNNKQATITLTTTGTSGAATFSSNTLNIPNYGSALSGYLPLTGGTLTGALGGTSASFSGTITSTITNNLVLSNNTSTTQYVYCSMANSVGNARYGVDNSSGNALGTNTSANSAVFGNAGNADVDITTNNISRLKIASTGAATFSSSITASSAITSTTAFGGTFKSSDGTNIVNFGSYYNTIGSGNSYDGVIYTTHASSALYLMTGGSTTAKVVITSNGNVGIGTSSPSGKLDLKTATANIPALGTLGNGFNMVRADGILGMSIGWENAVGSWYWQGQRTDSAATLNLALQPLGGNVGIGTTSPAQKLDVSGNIMSSGSSTILMLNNTGGTAQSWWVGQDTAGTNDGIFYIYNMTSSTQAINIRKNNNVLIGTSTDNGERLYVSGAIRATGTITANSDLTLKKNLLKIENALEKLEQINGYTYEFKEDDSKRHAGVIAQEIQTVLPEIVNTGNDGLMGVEYGNISALLIEAIKEQNIKIKNLETLLASK